MDHFIKVCKGFSYYLAKSCLHGESWPHALVGGGNPRYLFNPYNITNRMKQIVSQLDLHLESYGTLFTAMHTFLYLGLCVFKANAYLPIYRLMCV